MSKLCTLKDLCPGSVIEVPKEYSSRRGETAIVLGLEYANKGLIQTSFVRPQHGDFIPTDLPAMPEKTEFSVTEDQTLRQDTVAAFVAQKLHLPFIGMSMGCDPEIFVTHKDGSIFPAWEFMPCEADALKAIKEWQDKSIGGVLAVAPDSSTCLDTLPAYWDGVQAEFAPWGKSCLETLHYGTRAGLAEVLRYAREKDKGAKLILPSVVELPEDIRKNSKDEHIQFRCSQSYNIYQDSGDGVPDAREYKYRCAGGHIHLGFTRKFTAPGIEQIVRGLDGILGVAGVSLAAGIDNAERRHTYGRAGEFRLPAHGIEYRVLSNFWLSHPAIAMLVFELGRATVRLAESGLFNLCWLASEQETRDVINNCDVEGARKILQRNAQVLAGMLAAIWPEKDIVRPKALATKMQKLALETIFNGIETVIKQPSDIEGNWKLNGRGWERWCRGAEDNWQSLTVSH